MKLKKTKNIYFVDLIKYYKILFPLFYWQLNFSTLMNRKMMRLSLFTKKHFFFIALLISTIILGVVLLGSSTDLHVAHFYGNMQIVIKISMTVVAISPCILQYDSFRKLWFQLRSVNQLIHHRLCHKINFQDFLHSFFLSVSSILAICFAYFVMKIISIIAGATKYFRISTATLKLVYLYNTLHVVFIISLFQFTYEMFGKYVNLAYQLNRSNMIFSKNPNTFENLKFYKEIHYKLWKLTHVINEFCGLSLVVFSAQVFFDVTYSIYFLFCQWDNSYTPWLPKTISIF